MRKANVIVFALVVLHWVPAPLPASDLDPSRFTYPRLYCTPDGNSHFLRVEDTALCKGHITVVGGKPGFFLFAR